MNDNTYIKYKGYYICKISACAPVGVKPRHKFYYRVKANFQDSHALHHGSFANTNRAKLFIDKDLLNIINRPLSVRAKAFAKAKHDGQKDDGGQDYFTAHICQVAKILRQVTKDQIVLAVGYLHDTLEDTDTTLDELTATFSKEVADLVNEVTHDGTNDNKGYYFPRLKTERAILVKFADRLSNLSRMASWNEKRQQHYLKKSKFWASKV